MSTEDEKLLKEAKKLPWDERLQHKNWKVRNDANNDLAALRDSITDPKDARLREFDELNAHVCDEKDPENWHVQVFRSIDSGSIKGFPKLVQEAKSQNLVCAKNLQIDKSIHNAYVKATRSAQHFAYIENQYFIGSSDYWSSHRGAG